MEVGKYKPYFPESAEGQKPSRSFIEKVERYEKILKKIKEDAAAAPAPAAVPAVAATPVVAAPPVEEPETAQSVADKALQNLAVTIIKDFGLKDPTLRKILTVTDELDAPEKAEETEELDLELPEEGAEAEVPAEDAELDLDLEGDLDAAPVPEGDSDIDLSLPEEPAAPAADDSEADKKKTDEKLKKLEDELLDVDKSEPLDLADFSFKN